MAASTQLCFAILQFDTYQVTELWFLCINWSVFMKLCTINQATHLITFQAYKYMHSFTYDENGGKKHLDIWWNFEVVLNSLYSLSGERRCLMVFSWFRYFKPCVVRYQTILAAPSCNLHKSKMAASIQNKMKFKVLDLAALWIKTILPWNNCHV